MWLYLTRCISQLIKCTFCSLLSKLIVFLSFYVQQSFCVFLWKAHYLLGIYRLDSIHMCFMITALTVWSPPNIVNVPFWNSLDIIFGCVEAVFLFQTSLSCLMKCLLSFICLKHKPYLLQGLARHHLIYSPPKCKNTHAYSYIAFTLHKLV